jgi:hypothetical protein
VRRCIYVLAAADGPCCLTDCCTGPLTLAGSELMVCRHAEQWWLADAGLPVSLDTIMHSEPKTSSLLLESILD